MISGVLCLPSSPRQGPLFPEIGDADQAFVNGTFQLHVNLKLECFFENLRIGLIHSTDKSVECYLYRRG